MPGLTCRSLGHAHHLRTGATLERVNSKRAALGAELADWRPLRHHSRATADYVLGEVRTSGLVLPETLREKPIYSAALGCTGRGDRIDEQVYVFCLLDDPE